MLKKVCDRVTNLLIEALTNGKYKQCACYLNHNGCHCISGVLIDLYHKETGEGKWADGLSFVHDDGYLSTADLNHQISSWCTGETIENNFSLLVSSNEARYFAKNDMGVSFEGMADEIKRDGLYLLVR